MASSSKRASSNGSNQSVTSEMTHVEGDPNILLDLNSQVALPYKWKQFLDLQTGEIYFIDDKGEKTMKDPRKPAISDGDDDSDEVNSYELAGCTECIMYCTVPKRLLRNCPVCNGRLLRFDGN